MNSSALRTVGQALTHPVTPSAATVQNAANANRQEAEKKSIAKGAGSTNDGDSLTKELLKAAGKVGAAAIAALGGFVGVVALAGTALLWERFDQAGIPAEQALAKVDQGQRIMYGAEALIIALLLAIAAVVLVWAFDSNATVTPLSIGVVGVLVVGGAVFGAFQHISWYWVVVAAAIAIVLGVAALVVADRTAGQFVPFAGAVVVATALFNLLVFFLVTEEHIPVTPAAVVQPDGTSFKGYYVADGTDNIYLAIPTGTANDVVLRTIPRGEGTDLGIGHAVDRADAGPKMTDVLKQLQEQPARKLTPQPPMP